jgi:hypothetical protein
VASDEVPEVSTDQRETFHDQLEESLVGQQMVVSTEVALFQDAEFDHGHQSGDFSVSETASGNFMHLEVVAEAALAWISYDFGLLTFVKSHLMSQENKGRYFQKDMGVFLVQSLFLIHGRMKLWCSRISLLPGFACRRI